MTPNKEPLRPIPAMIPKKEEEPLTPEQLEELQKEAAKLRNESNCKMISVALMEAALRYRQGHYLEEIERFEEQVMEDFKTHKDYNKPGWARKYESVYRKKILEYRESKEAVNRALEKEIKDLTNALKKESAAKFDDFATIFGEVATELIHAKSRKDFHLVCKMYNMGYMEKALQEIKDLESKTTESHETTEKPRQTVGDLTASFDSASLQETDNLSIVTEESSGQSNDTGNTDNEPHEQGGGVQDDVIQQDNGAGHEPAPDTELP